MREKLNEFVQAALPLRPSRCLWSFDPASVDGLRRDEKTALTGVIVEFGRKFSLRAADYPSLTQLEL